MHDELVKRLRDAAKMSDALAVLLPHSEGNATAKLYNEAADAIEELATNYDAATDIMMHQTDYIEELEANKPRWIPVTERLPEEKTYVLILFDTIAGKMQGVCFLYKDDDGHNCWTWLDRLVKNLFDIQPTHWMPLQQPPKEETT